MKKKSRDSIRSALAAELGRRSWAAKVKKYGRKKALEMMSEMGKKGGYPKGRPRKRRKVPVHKSI